jgi:hypothetical protein
LKSTLCPSALVTLSDCFREICGVRS